MKKVICPYCGRRAAFVDTREIYGVSYGMAYLCRPCGAYVGCHGDSDVPKGTLANAELRYWRKQAHGAFDPLWKTGPYRHHRNGAYEWLAAQMRLPKEKTHIGMFDVAQCKQVIQICKGRSY